MKKAKLNTKLTIAGALLSGLLMVVLVFGYASEKMANNNDNTIEAIQLADNGISEAIVFSDKCGGEKDAEKKGKEEGKAESKDEKSAAKTGEGKEMKCGEGKCGGDDAKAKDSDAKDSDAKDGDAKEGKCGERKCGGDSKEAKCGEGKCG